MTVSPGTRRLLIGILASSLLTNLLLLGGIAYVLVLTWQADTEDVELELSPFNSPPETRPPSNPEVLPPPSRRPETSSQATAKPSEEEWKTLRSGRPITRRGAHGPYRSIQCRFLILAPPSAIYRCLTDYDNLLNLYNDLHTMRILEQDESHSIIYFEGKYGFLKLGYVLDRTHVLNREIRWKKLDHPDGSQRLRDCYGSWRFDPTGQEGMTLVTYTSFVDIPLLPKGIVTKLLESNLPHFIQTLRREVRKYARD